MDNRIEFMKSFWERLEAVRKERNIQQKEFAHSIEMDANQYSLAKTRCAEIRISVVAKIVELYDIDANWLFSGKKSKHIDKGTLTKLTKIAKALNDVIS